MSDTATPDGLPRVDLAWRRGTTYRRTFRLEAGGLPVDLTDYTALRLEVRAWAGAPLELTLATPDQGMTWPADRTTGEVALEVDEEVTDTLAAGHHYHYLEGDRGADVVPLWAGVLEVVD